MYEKYNNYDKYPETRVDGFTAFTGFEAIADEIKRAADGKQKSVVVLDLYPGTTMDDINNIISALSPAKTFCAEDCMISDSDYKAFIDPYMTDDRVFGIMNNIQIEDLFIYENTAAMRNEIENTERGMILVYGVGAGVITTGDIYVYCDMARWEIQLRFRKGMPNFKYNNSGDPVLNKFKCGYFIEWRYADRHKNKMFNNFDFVIETNEVGSPKMITADAFFAGFRKASEMPFRTVPYFDPGVWGGQWMKDVCGLDKSQSNFAWSFDGVPEENSMLFRFGETRLEFPAIDLVFLHPENLLGERVYRKFGAEFPIRFDFLDTMGGQNLSLQVHPKTEYIKKTFGMKYTQDESYYILDCEDDATVYLGIKEGADPDEMINALREANKGGESFDAEKYVNRFPAKKHDHFLIPAGTVHCSGSNAMVLEISATPYIFTFKLWDWDRLGLDGLPRPVHIDHGEKNIEWSRTTDWVKKNLVDTAKVISEDDGVEVEKTGLHELEFIETERFTFTKPVEHQSNGSVCVFNLVEGAEALITSPDNAFEPFTVHYAETFIIPASVERYVISPTEKSNGAPIKTIKAYIRKSYAPDAE